MGVHLLLSILECFVNILDLVLDLLKGFIFFAKLLRQDFLKHKLIGLGSFQTGFGNLLNPLGIVSVYSLKLKDLLNGLNSATFVLKSVTFRPSIFSDVWIHFFNESLMLLFFRCIVCWSNVEVVGQVLVFLTSFVDQIVFVYLDLGHLFGVPDLETLKNLPLCFLVLLIKL